MGITDDALATTEAAKNFIIDNGGTRIINRNPLTMNQVTLDNGNTVSPVVDAGNFSLTVDTDELELAFTDMTFEYSTGITMHLGFSSRGKIILNSTTAGPESLDLAIVTQKITPPYTTIDAGLAKTTLILSVVTAAVTAVSGGLAFYAKAAATAASRAATVGEAGADAASNAGREVSQSMEADGSIEMQSISREAGAVVPAMTRAEIQAMVTATATNILSRAAVPVGALATWAPRVAKVALALAFCNGVSAGIIKSLQDIAEHRYDSMPNINSLLAGAIGSTVQWPAAMDSYTLYNAQLNEALQFGLK